MRSLILILHIIVSTGAFISTCVVITRALMGLYGRMQLSALDVKLPLLSTILLYINLVMGGTLFLFHMLEYNSGPMELLPHNQMAKGRFWAMEHFILMVFTLVISHIGWVFARNNRTPRIIFKKNVLYFGLAGAMIMVSMVMNILRYSV